MESSRIAHRIVEVLTDSPADCAITDELQFRTKGDANEFADPYCIRAAQITAQVTAVLPPAFGIALVLIRQNLVPIAAAALLLVAGGFMASGIRDGRRARRADVAAAAPATEEGTAAGTDTTLELVSPEAGHTK